MAVKADHSHHI